MVLIIVLPWASRTMVQNITQSSHHKFRVIHTREYTLRPTTIKESEQKAQVTITNSSARLWSPSGEGGGAAIANGKSERSNEVYQMKMCDLRADRPLL